MIRRGRVRERKECDMGEGEEGEREMSEEERGGVRGSERGRDDGEE